jgi:hypothetical protein
MDAGLLLPGNDFRAMVAFAVHDFRFLKNLLGAEVDAVFASLASIWKDADLASRNPDLGQVYGGAPIHFHACHLSP